MAVLFLLGHYSIKDRNGSVNNQEQVEYPTKAKSRIRQ